MILTTVIGRAGQTIYDLAIQHYGDAQGVDWILEDNPSLDPSLELEDMLVFIRKDVINRPIKNYLSHTTITTY